MKLSIVINTLNRSHFLKRTIEALSLQEYDDFEVIAVNGPSTDTSQQMLEKYFKNRIKIQRCDVANLSVSRNIGIKAASGDVVVFIDDDAIPASRKWLSHIAKAFTDTSVGGVGGKVLRLNEDVEFQNGCVNIYGSAITINESSLNYNDKNGRTFNYAQGANCAYRRDILLKIGGFDEYYEYFHDESNVAIRIIKEGYKIVHIQAADVYHEAATGENRKSRYHLNWYSIVKNQVYFGLKESVGYDSLEIRKKEVKKLVDNRLAEFKLWYKESLITKEDYTFFIREAERGYKQGFKDGLEKKRALNFDLDNPSNTFLKFNSNDIKPKLNICFISEENPLFAKGGAEKYIFELAKGLILKGIPVHIVTPGKSGNSFMKDGINFHYVDGDINFISELSDLHDVRKNIAFSYEAMKCIRKLMYVYGINIVESPLWDYCAIVTANMLNIPVITRLVTPIILAKNIFGWENSPSLELHIDFERLMLEKSAGIIYISDSVKQTIEELHNYKFTQLSEKCILGLPSPLSYNFESKSPKKKLVFFFIGRLERRKGIHNLLEAAAILIPQYDNIEFRIAGKDNYDHILNDTFSNWFKNNFSQDVQSKVTFLGVINDAEKEDELKKCDIFVAPSLYESFGIVFLEAMQYGKPIIATNGGGCKEVISHKETGLLVEPGDTPCLAEAMKTLIEDKQLRRQMGENGLQRFKKMFTLENMTDQSISFYKKVLEKRL